MKYYGQMILPDWRKQFSVLKLQKEIEPMSIITIMRLLGFCLSSLGWWAIFVKKSEVNVYFIPSLTIAIQVDLLFLCGLLNLLQEGAWVIFSFGIIALLSIVIKTGARSAVLKPFGNVGFLFFGIALISMALFLRGKIFTHYDNFSHWALVVTQMLEKNRYPTFLDTLITFQEYPLGSASFIYYFAKTVGSDREAVMMFAQLYMILASILPLFTFLKKNRFFGLCLIVAATNFFLTYSISATELLVDTLLPLAGMCGIVFTLLYCGDRGNWKSILFATGYAIMLVQIKNSGVFFAGIICIWILVKAYRSGFVLRIGSFIATVGSMVLWHRHCAYVFPRANMSSHALTFSRFRYLFDKKTPEEIRAIIIAVADFIIKWKDVWITLGMFLALGIIILLCAKKEFVLFKKSFAACICLYIVYQLGMIGMYLFSMYTSEALNLGGIVRYSRTAVIAVMYVYTALSLKTVSALRMEQAFSSVAVALLLPVSFCVFLFLSAGKVKSAFTYTSYSGGPRERLWLEAAAENYGVPRGQSCCILIPQQDSGYAYYLGRYTLRSDAVSTLVADEESKLDDIQSDYIFVYDEDNEIVKNWILKNYPEQTGEKVIIVEKDS